MNKVLVSDIEKYLNGTYDWDENPDNIDFDFTLPNTKEKTHISIECYLQYDEITKMYDFVEELEYKNSIKNNTFLTIYDWDRTRIYFSEYLYNQFDLTSWNNRFLIVEKKQDTLGKHFVLYRKTFETKVVDNEESISHTEEMNPYWYVGNGVHYYYYHYRNFDISNNFMMQNNINKKVLIWISL